MKEVGYRLWVFVWCYRFRHVAIAALPGHFFNGGTTGGGFVAPVDFGRKSINHAKCITCYPSTGN